LRRVDRPAVTFADRAVGSKALRRPFRIVKLLAQRPIGLWAPGVCPGRLEKIA
jgi:hypothetical protein